RGSIELRCRLQCAHGPQEHGAKACLLAVVDRLVQQAFAKPLPSCGRSYEVPTQLCFGRGRADNGNAADNLFFLLRNPDAHTSPRLQDKFGERPRNVGLECRIEAVLLRVGRPVKGNDTADVAGLQIITEHFPSYVCTSNTRTVFQLSRFTLMNSRWRA